MNEDFRLRIDLHDDGFAHRLSQSLQAEEIEHDLEHSYGDRVVVSVDGGEVFLYSADRAQAEAAQRLVERTAAEHGWQIDVDLRRWHPQSELWEDPDLPLPDNPTRVANERAQRNAVERRESAEQGYPSYEVRIQCASRAAAGKLSEKLDHEDVPHVRRWSYVLVGAVDEDDAQALAKRLADEVTDATITVEINPRSVWENLPGNPFAILGGLAG